MKYNFDEMISRIKYKKKLIGLTNEELSSISGVPAGTLNKILGSETKEPKLDTILKISDALNVPAEYLIYGVEKIPNASTFFTTKQASKIIKKLPKLTDDQLESVEKRIDTYIEDNEMKERDVMAGKNKKAT